MALKNNSNKSFTLVELVIVISIIAAISFLIAPVLLVGMDSWNYIKGRSDLINDARLAMNRMVREIREAEQIDSWENDKIEFTDINGNTIEFRQEGSLLLRNGDELAKNLKETDGFSLNYWNNNGNPAVTADEVVRVGIMLRLKNQTGELKIKNQVYIRNYNE